MIFEQHYLDCLSQASYLIGDQTTGRAVVVDPRRDVDEYLRSAAEHGLRIELVIETHFHADFLSGHLELAEATGATIAYGDQAAPEFPARLLADGERISLGDVVLEIRSTPGHTPESISVVVFEHADDAVPFGVLTGDTLFIGDVGRPDLLTSVGVTAEELGTMLYRSVHDKLLTLPDDTKVFPGHGAGSACGKSLSTETSSTIGEQRRTNYALAPMGVDEFVAVVTDGQPSAPGYFAFDAGLNKRERPLLDEHAEVRSLTLAEVDALRDEGATIIDTREAAEFAAGHLRGSVNVGLGGRFAEYVGSIVDPTTPVVLVVDPDGAVEARNRLARIGFDNVVGQLADPLRTFVEHDEVVERSSRVSAADLAQRQRDGVSLQVVDIRNDGEVRLGTIDGAAHIPLAELRRRLSELDAARPTVVFCAGGYRSSIAASLLAAEGFDDVSDLLGGYAAYTAR